MKNVPRIFIGETIVPGSTISVSNEVLHYLTRVMRTDHCLVFGDGNEYTATISSNGRGLVIGEQTAHTDPSNGVTLMFSPIKRTDDLLNMATQMGVARFVPVITNRTNANHINWERMRKIVIEAAEQSNRNTVPQILPTVRFEELDLSTVVFADERTTHGHGTTGLPSGTETILIGPEGGFSEQEFAALDASGAVGFSLGKTILRAEVAAVVAITQVLLQNDD